MADAPRKAEMERERSKEISALAALWPFMKPYGWLIALAGIALVTTAMMSLVLPLAVRRVIDNFDIADPSLLDGYFAAGAWTCSTFGCRHGAALLFRYPIG